MMEYLELAIRYHIKVSEVYTYDIKLHNFSQFNKEFGWKKGDEFLVHFARFINNLYENRDHCITIRCHFLLILQIFKKIHFHIF